MILATTIAMLLVANPSVSPDAKRIAQQSFAEAEAAFGRREYAAAAAAFEQAARAVPHPAPWLNAAEAWEKAGELSRASDDCAEALAIAEGFAVHQKSAAACLARLEPKVGPRRPPAPPPSPDEGQVDLTVTAPPPPPPLSVVTATVAPGPVIATGGPPVASWVAFGVAGTATALTVVFGALTVGSQGDFEAAPTRDSADTFYAHRLETNVALSVAVVAGGTGLLLWWLER